MKFTAIHPNLLPSVWPHVSPLLGKAVSLNPEVIDLDDVYAGALAGIYVVWAAVDEASGEFVGAITTRIITYPKTKALAMDFIGGTRMKEWLQLSQSAVEEHAKRNGCTHLEGYGRRAWSRYLEPLGWGQAYITYKKEL
tara:strand:- start:4476 stop:4892 length:417 start_codon:yes stop_codon:yes gene_type:complete